MKGKRLSAVLALPLVVAMAASACGGSSGGNGNNGGKAKVTGTAPIDINAQPASKIKDGGTLIWSSETFGPQYNYNQLDGTEGSLAEVDNAVLPAPTITDAQGNVSYDPAYWLSVKETSTNPQTVEYKLNPKAKWSNGT